MPAATSVARYSDFECLHLCVSASPREMIFFAWLAPFAVKDRGSVCEAHPTGCRRCRVPALYQRLSMFICGFISPWGLRVLRGEIGGIFRGAATAGLRPGRGADIISTVLPTGCSSVWLERVPWAHEVAGSSPVTPICCGVSSVTYSFYMVYPAVEHHRFSNGDFAGRVS